MSARLAVVVTSVLWLACGGLPTAPRDVPLGQEFELATGQSAAVDESLRLTFEQVVSDSRCPADALCVWAGDAVIRMTLDAPGSSAASAELHTAAGFDSTTVYKGFQVRLVKVQPYPYSNTTIPAKDYRATLVVSRAASPAP